MANYKAHGMIIKRSNFGEADRLVSIYTREKGKIRVLAKGARKQTSKLGGHLELFCLCSLVVAEGRNLDIVTEAEIIEPHFKIRDNLEKTNASHYLAEMIDSMAMEEEAHPDIFELLLKTFDKLNKGSSDLLLPYFQINFLKAIGYQPELLKCVHCRVKIEEFGNVFDYESGGLSCGDCSRIGSAAISSDTIKVLRLLLSNNIEVIEKLKLPPKKVKEIITCLDNYIKHHNNEDFKSRRFLK